MDWVKKRATRREILQKAAPRLWAHLRSAMNQAVQSYGEHFTKETSLLIDYESIDIQKSLITGKAANGGERRRAEIVLVSGREPFIEAQYNGGDSMRVRFAICSGSDDQVCFQYKDEEQPIEEVSELLLKPLLFPDES